MTGPLFQEHESQESNNYQHNYINNTLLLSDLLSTRNILHVDLHALIVKLFNNNWVGLSTFFCNLAFYAL